MTYDFSSVFRDDLPPPAQRFTGFPAFNFVGGHNAEEMVPVEAFRAAADAVLAREGETLGMYGLHSGPQGYGPLRRWLADKLKRYAAVDCGADDILLTSGSLQAIDLINDVLLEPGDTVVVEADNYGGVFPRLARCGAQPTPVALDADGMRMDALEATLDDLAARGVKPKYIYTIPTVQNPTGTILPLERRRRMLELAKAHDVPVFEDECYADLVWSGARPPALKALDDDGRVIHIGSFSKTIAPALRVGYIVAGWPILSRILSVKTDAGSGALEQMVLAEFCQKHFDGHLQRLNERLEAKLDNLTGALDAFFGTSVSYTRPPGGIFLWVRMPDGVDTTRLAEVAGQAGIAVNPGAEWSLAGDAGRWIRICFANPPEATTSAGIEALARVCHEEFGVPEISGNVRL
ncbi:PLP-dependent aminotransferase family protein [Minwuia thermotolerans]|uniref:Aminotransferase n=1 Tax=Minwuia thermotolerans TaxID=2056226 RepID=A0A2M9FZN2_9PROT|nr:PLP-dependent aminotransferase family protein [Minwuia thermotolerans]PJK28899.1 aminotransferase [Minwuia thermotolerans]